MSTTTTRSDGIVCVPRTGTLYDVLELILDRGMVIDVFVRVSLVGIEILKIDARVVVASVDTYLRFAEACNRLDLESDEHSRTVPELFGGASGKARAVGARKAAKAVGGKVKEAVGAGGDDDEEDDEAEAEPARRPGRSGARSRAVGASRTRRSREG
jgi:gas vesicle structural protein